MAEAEKIQPQPVLNTDTLFGDLRDAILDRLKAMPKPWTVMSEQEQRDEQQVEGQSGAHVSPRLLVPSVAAAGPTLSVSPRHGAMPRVSARRAMT